MLLCSTTAAHLHLPGSKFAVSKLTSHMPHHSKYKSELLMLHTKVLAVHSPCLFQALDISACNSLTASGVQQIAQACPRLRLLRLGGSIRSNQAAAVVVPQLVPPHILQRSSQPADSWEDLPLGEFVGPASVAMYFACHIFASVYV